MSNGFRGEVLVPSVFLFNTVHPSFKGLYGAPLTRHMLRAVQPHSAQFRRQFVTTGDVPMYRYWHEHQAVRATGDYPEFCRTVYRSATMDRVLRDRLERTGHRTTVWYWMFEDLPADTAQLVHESLREHDTYLGAMGVDTRVALHAELFCMLPPAYEIDGLSFSPVHEIGCNSADCAIDEIFDECGFRQSCGDIPVLGFPAGLFGQHDVFRVKRGSLEAREWGLG